jgi:gas vesicle protein
MDWGTITAGIIGCIAGNLTALLFFPQMRKTKNIENEAKQSEEWKKLFDGAKNEIKEKDDKIDSLYVKIESYRDEELNLQKQLGETVVENVKLKIMKCEVPSCLKRTPPTGF